MANLSKIQVAEIIRNAPPDTTPEGIVAALRQKGHVLEGYPIQETETQAELPQEKSGLQKASDILGTVFGGQKIGEAIGTGIAKLNAKPEERKFIEGPKISEVAGDVVSTGLSVAGLKGVGLAGNFLSRLLKTIGIGAGISGGKSLSEGGDAGEVLKDAVTGGAVSAAIPVVGAGLRAIGGQIEQLPARFVNSALGRSKAQVLQDISKDKADDFAKYVIETKPALKSANSHLLDTNKSIQELNEQINTSLASSIRKSGEKVTIGRNNFLDEITQLPEAQGALLKRDDVRGVIERLAPQTKQLLAKESLTIPEANKLRQLVDKTLGDRAFLGGQLSSDKIILKKFGDTLRETVKTKAPEGTRELFREISNEIRFRDNLLEKIAKRQGNQVLSFGDFIGGGLGGVFGGGLPGAIAGVATRRALESVPFKISAAKLTDAVTKAEPLIKDLTPAQQTILMNLIGELLSSDGEDDNKNNQE